MSAINFSREHIRIAFDPLSERFEVANAATAQDPTFISSVAEVSKPGANAFQVANDYLAQLGAARALMGKTLTAEETGRI